METVLRRYIFVFFIFNNSIVSSAQQNVNLRAQAISKVLFEGNYFAFYLSPYMSQKAKTVRQSGAYSLSTANSSGIEVGGNYFINFNDNYSLVTGAHAGFSARNFKLFILKSDFNPSLENDINYRRRLTKDYALYLSAPVWVERRWIRKNNTTWNVDAGINLRFDPEDVFYFYDFGASDTDGQYKQVFSMNGMVGNNVKPWLNYNISGGYSVFLSNYNFLRINLLANFSATKIVNFNYTIDVSGKPQSTGTYSSNLSYIGLSINYILTGTNKRLVKLYERDMTKVNILIKP